MPKLFGLLAILVRKVIPGKPGRVADQEVEGQFRRFLQDHVAQVDRQFQSDISVVLHPLPKLPVMICYWRPDEGLGSSINVFFDETADRNLDIGSIFSLGAGMTQMFQKLALRHGSAEVR